MKEPIHLRPQPMSENIVNIHRYLMNHIDEWILTSRIADAVNLPSDASISRKIRDLMYHLSSTRSPYRIRKRGNSPIEWRLVRK